MTITGAAVIVLTLLAPWLERQRSEAEDDIRASMQAVLRRVARNGHPRSRFQDQIGRWVRLGIPPSRLVGRLARLEREFAGGLELRLFDHRLEPVFLPGRPRRAAYPAQQCLRFWLDPARRPNPKMVERLLGNPDAARQMAGAMGQLVDLRNGWRFSWAGWWTLTDRRQRPLGYLLAVVHRQAIDPDALLDRAVGEAQRLTADRMTIGWRDPAVPRVLRPPRRAWPPELVARLDRLPVGRLSTRCGARPAELQVTAGGELLFCLALAEAGIGGGWAMVRSGVFATVIILFALVAWPAAWRRLPALGLRGKLTAWFVVGGAIPLGALLAMAVYDRVDREALLVRRVQAEDLGRLQQIDDQLPTGLLPLVARYERALRELAQRPLAHAPGILAPLADWVERQAGLVQMFGLMDRRLALRFHCHPRADWFAKGYSQIPADLARHDRQSMRDMMSSIVRRLNQGDARQPPGGDESIVGMVVGLKGSDSWLRDRGSFQLQQVGDDTMLAWLQVLPSGPDRQYRGVFVAVHNSRLAQVRHLARLIRVPATHGSDEVRIAAVPLAPSRRWPAFPRRTTGDDPVLARLRDDVIDLRLPRHEVATVGGRRYLLSAVAGRYLDGYALVAARPYAGIERETRQLDRQLSLLVGVLLASMAVMAWLASAWLLEPMAGLRIGLDALRRRDFRVSLRPGRVAELAAMTARFNRIIEDLRDLGIARSVQEQLWPAEPLTGPGFRVAGACRSATDLGGDHHDWYRLPDGRLALLVGDVAGHGIPAALVMAAAKVALALQLGGNLGTPSPGDVLIAVSHRIHQLFGRDRPMTMWLGLFDPDTRRLSYASAGHSYPIVAITGQPPVFAGKPGLPLGVRPGFPYPVSDLDLTAGATLVAYSDGLVEATAGLAGESFGYDRLQAAVQALAGRDPETIVASLLQQIADWSGRAIAEDDQTVVVLDVEARR